MEWYVALPPGLQSLCVTNIVKDGNTTLFWLDKWADSHAMHVNIWLEDFSRTAHPFGIVRDLAQLLV